jgi:hypothetical protein
MHPHQTAFYRVNDSDVAVFDVNFPERPGNELFDYLDTIMQKDVGASLVIPPMKIHNSTRLYCAERAGPDAERGCSEYVRRWEEMLNPKSKMNKYARTAIEPIPVARRSLGRIFDGPGMYRKRSSSKPGYRVFKNRYF